MSGLLWPEAELILAAAAKAHGFPYTLSIVANETPEAVAKAGGQNAWFQLYTPAEPEIEDDLIERVGAAGIETLVVTVDVPVGRRCERQLAAGLTVPPKVTPLMLWRVAQRPQWALATLRHGQPRFWTLEKDFVEDAMKDAAKMVGTIVDGRPDWDTVRRIREKWRGSLVIKGTPSGEETLRTLHAGADDVVVLSHGGRQFDAAPPAIDALPDVAKVVAGRVPLLFDSGILWWPDIARALSRGADFCLLGRGFLYAVAAL